MDNDYDILYFLFIYIRFIYSGDFMASSSWMPYFDISSWASVITVYKLCRFSAFHSQKNTIVGTLVPCPNLNYITEQEWRQNYFSVPKSYFLVKHF